MLYITLRQYEYVVAVADAQSMVAAAERLNVSQPALSVALKAVEVHLGKVLFVRRKGARIRPTAFAHAFLPQARDLLRIAAQLENPNAEQTKGAPVLRLGCFDDLAPLWLAAILGHLRRLLPDLAVLPQVGSFEMLAAGVSEGSIDLAITYDLGLDAAFARDRLVEISPGAFVAASDGLSGRTSVCLNDLSKRPLILFEEGLSIRHMLRLFEGQGLRPMVAHRVASLEVMRSFAAHGEGIGISYANPPGNISYDGKQVVRVAISDVSAKEPVVVTYMPDLIEVPVFAAAISAVRRFAIYQK
jgi:DNA-binding transcriptional LysR family regulator